MMEEMKAGLESATPELPQRPVREEPKALSEEEQKRKDKELQRMFQLDKIFKEFDKVRKTKTLILTSFLLSMVLAAIFFAACFLDDLFWFWGWLYRLLHDGLLGITGDGGVLHTDCRWGLYTSLERQWEWRV